MSMLLTDLLHLCTSVFRPPPAPRAAARQPLTVPLHESIDIPTGIFVHNPVVKHKAIVTVKADVECYGAAPQDSVPADATAEVEEPAPDYGAAKEFDDNIELNEPDEDEEPEVHQEEDLASPSSKKIKKLERLRESLTSHLLEMEFYNDWRKRNTVAEWEPGIYSQFFEEKAALMIQPEFVSPSNDLLPSFNKVRIRRRYPRGSSNHRRHELKPTKRDP